MIILNAIADLRITDIAVLILVRYRVSGFQEQGTGNREQKGIPHSLRETLYLSIINS